MSRSARLSLWQAALVIARRDFTAIVFSKVFLLFLIGPLFFLAISAGGGYVGAMAADNATRPPAATRAPDRPAVRQAVRAPRTTALAATIAAAGPDTENRAAASGTRIATSSRRAARKSPASTGSRACARSRIPIRRSQCSRR